MKKKSGNQPSISFSSDPCTEKVKTFGKPESEQTEKAKTKNPTKPET